MPKPSAHIRGVDLRLIRPERLRRLEHQRPGAGEADEDDDGKPVTTAERDKSRKKDMRCRAGKRTPLLQSDAADRLPLRASCRLGISQSQATQLLVKALFALG